MPEAVQALKALKATGRKPGSLLMRHKRKYATGDMGYNSFYFNGPAHRLNLKANNLMMFIQMGSGVDDDTWSYHLRRHDYYNWFRHSVKDESLAVAAEQVENGPDDSRV